MGLEARLYSLFEATAKADIASVSPVRNIDTGDGDSHDLYVINAKVDGRIESYTMEDYDDGFIVIYDQNDNTVWQGQF